MSLSRVLIPGKHGPKIVAVTSKRTDIHIPRYYDAEEHEKLNKYREMYLGGGGKGDDARSVGFVGRLIARFKGEALPGEKQPPEALFKNIGMDFIPPEPIPRMPADYKENPERDIKNFPYPQRHMFPLKTRMVVFPDSWFQAFNHITGSSGSYAFMFTFSAFLINKELIVYDENMALLFYGWIFWYTILRHAFGPRLDEWGHNLFKKQMDKHYKVIREDLEAVSNFKKLQAARKDALVTAKENFPSILKENMDLQLEVAYRKNIEKVATELKRRLDYLKDTENVKTRLERTIYLNQIIEGVRKQIEANENGIKDAYLDYCIDQLKVLADRQCK